MMSPTTTPPLHLLEPLTVVVPTRWRTTSTLRVDSTSISWDGTSLDLNSIDTVAYWVRSRTRNLVQRGLERHVELRSGASSLQIAIGTSSFATRRDNAQHHAYGVVVDTLYSSVEPRLRSDLLRRIASGESIAIDRLVLDRDGVTSDSSPERRVAWDALPTATIEGNRVSVRVATTFPNPITWTTSAGVPNAVLLPELMAEAAEAFS